MAHIPEGSLTLFQFLSLVRHCPPLHDQQQNKSDHTELSPSAPSHALFQREYSFFNLFFFLIHQQVELGKQTNKENKPIKLK